MDRDRNFVRFKPGERKKSMTDNERHLPEIETDNGNGNLPAIHTFKSPVLPSKTVAPTNDSKPITPPELPGPLSSSWDFSSCNHGNPNRRRKR